MPIIRPKNEEELQKREAIGVIRASRFVRKYAQSHKKIDIDTICSIHKEIFKDAWPEIAGMYRQEELSITGSDLVLPHPNEIHNLMKKLNEDLIIQIEELKDCEGCILGLSTTNDDDLINCISKLVHRTAWLHHKITAIHPFREGNGRTARLVANLLLERYGLIGISVKLEKENKNEYRKSLRQIDLYDDYEPLEAIIYEGINDRYEGVTIKYYKA